MQPLEALQVEHTEECITNLNLTERSEKGQWLGDKTNKGTNQGERD